MIIAHRGAGHAGSPPAAHENTLAAFETAIAGGADAIEFDLRRTADGKIVIHHDASVNGAGRSITDSPLKEVRRQAITSGFQIATFEETLQSCAGKIALDIELKEPGYGAEILTLTEKYYDLAHVAFTSFSDEAIIEIKRLEHRAITGLLLGELPPIGMAGRLNEIFPRKRIRECHPDIIAPNWRFLKWFRRHQTTYLDLPIIVWTVNDQKYAGKLIESKIAAIISDIPDQLLPPGNTT